MSLSTPPPPQQQQQRHRFQASPPPASRDADVHCPAGVLVEELVEANPCPSTPHTFSSFLRSIDIRHPSDLAIFLRTPSPTAPRAAAASPSGQFDTANFLHGHLSSILSGGATIEIVVDGSGPAGSDGTNLGDYYLGSVNGLEQLMQQLAENDPNRYGTLPTAKSAISSLLDVLVFADMVAADGGAQCAVCMDDFPIGAKAKQLPCNHIFHKDCILPWLDLHSSCPVCRFGLPTEEVTPGAPSTSGIPSPVSERRFSISLPSLMAALGDQAEIRQDAAPCAGSSDDLD